MLGGIDLGGTKIEACLFDDDLNEVIRRRVPTPRDAFEPLLDALVDQYSWLREQSGQSALRFGVAMPGVVDSRTGHSLASNLPTAGRSLWRELSARVGFAVPMENDCKCFAFSEANGGTGDGFQTVFGLILGTGCGAGVCHDGRLVSSLNNLPGEVGHLGIAANMMEKYHLPLRTCPCGRTGCYETLVSGPGLAALGRHLRGLELTSAEINRRAADGDEDCAAVMVVWADVLCELIRTIEATVDPDCIVLGGGLSRMSGIVELIEQRMPPLLIHGMRPPVITLARFGDTSGVRGAAMLARDVEPHRTLPPTIAPSTGSIIMSDICNDLSGLILTQAGWMRGRVHLKGERIERIEGKPLTTIDGLDEPIILPGFIDLHIHGAMGQDYASGEDGIREFIRYHARQGTVALAPTTSTSTVEVIERSLRDIETVRTLPRADEPHVLGAHLEGPFINPGKLGAQRDITLKGDAALALRWNGLCPLVVATVAPEIEGGMEVIEALAGQGCRVQVGHSLATAEQCAEAFGRGMSGFTHLFNGMSGTHHREPGAAAYALSNGRYAELICDLNHVHPAMVMAAYRAIPRLYAITDATTAAGLPDGNYNFGGDHPIVKKGLTIMLADGSSLAGSSISMLDAFRNLVSIGLPIAVASELCATRQAEYLGLADFGEIAPGRSASMIVLDRRLEVQAVWLRGKAL